MRSHSTLTPVRFALARRFYAVTTEAPGGGGSTDPAGKPGASGDSTGNPAPQDFPKDKDGNRLFTQAEINAARAEEKRLERAKAQEAADKAKREAEEAGLTEQQKHKELAEQRKARIDALEPENVKLREHLAAVLGREIATWPDSVKKVLPPEDSDLMVRWEAVDRMRELATELMGKPGAGSEQKPGEKPGEQKPPATRPDPKPAAPGGSNDDDLAAKRDMAASYSNF